MDDRAEWNATEKAMDTMGISEEEKNGIVALTAGKVINSCLTDVIVVGVLKRGVPKSRNLSNLGSFCRYVGQGLPPQVWGPSTPLWGRYEFLKFFRVFQRANHNLALSDIFSKIKSKFFLVVERSPRDLRVTKKKLGLP